MSEKSVTDPSEFDPGFQFYKSRIDRARNEELSLSKDSKPGEPSLNLQGNFLIFSI